MLCLKIFSLSKATLNVTICSYNFAKRFNLNVNYESLIKGCLLHDFFLYQQYKCPKGSIHAWYHPKEAYKNASKYYDINKIEKDMILKHMFPTNPFLFPKYKETWIIILCDKYCATMECFFKKNYLVEIKAKEREKRELRKFFINLKNKIFVN